MFQSWWQRPLSVIGEHEINWLNILSIIAVLSFAWLLAATVEKSIRAVLSRTNGAASRTSSVYAISRLSRYAVWLFSSMVGLSMLGVDLSGIAFFTGAFGLAVGFGMQTIFSNFVAGLILMFERTLSVGDFVDLESGIRGHVREIAMRYTRIETNGAVDVIIPNAELINKRLVNWTYGSPYRRMKLPFGMPYGCDKELVRQAAKEAARKVNETIWEEPRAPDVWLVSFGDSCLNFELVVWVRREAVLKPGSTEARYLWALDDALRAHGLQVPFPQREIHLHSANLAGGAMPR